MTDRTATQLRASSPENGLSDLLHEFLGRRSSGDIDLDHAVPVVEPIHPKAMPVILTTNEERDVWQRAP